VTDREVDGGNPIDIEGNQDAIEEAENFPEIRPAVARLCAQFPCESWRELYRDAAYPTDFGAALTEAGYLAALIPEAYGGAGLSHSAAAAILEEIQRAAANGAASHAQMYIF
jgi:alkylation response protein AidB-like acyl-CoA dehydrogenase